MDIEVEIIEFKVPYENNKTIFLWGIQPGFTEAFIYESLWKVFSAFGPLYMLKVCPNAALAEPGFYALVKYFSAVQASQAQRATEGRCLFQTTPLRVRMSSKLPSYLSDPSSRRPLSHSRCQDLANHYLGFNGWSTHIITLKDLSSEVDDQGQDPPGAGPGDGGSLQEKSLRYGCMVELSFPKHQLSCRGVGIAEETFLVSSPEVSLLKTGKLQRWARDKAVVQAFEKVLLLLLGNGKVVVEVRVDRDEVLPEDHLEGLIQEGLIQVNNLPWSQSNPEEEEEDWDLTVNV